MGRQPAGHPGSCFRCGICCHIVINHGAIIGKGLPLSLRIAGSDGQNSIIISRDIPGCVSTIVSGRCHNQNPIGQRFRDRRSEKHTVSCHYCGGGDQDDSDILSQGILKCRIDRGKIREPIAFKCLNRQDPGIRMLLSDPFRHQSPMSVLISRIIPDHGHSCSRVAIGSGIDQGHIIFIGPSGFSDCFLHFGKGILCPGHDFFGCDLFDKILFTVHRKGSAVDLDKLRPGQIIRISFLCCLHIRKLQQIQTIQFRQNHLRI